MGWRRHTLIPRAAVRRVSGIRPGDGLPGPDFAGQARCLWRTTLTLRFV